MNKYILLKVDLDTFLGAKNYVSNLLELFRKYQIKATFLLSFGPDNSGRGIFKDL
jgi:hypothetical protein